MQAKKQLSMTPQYTKSSYNTGFGVATLIFAIVLFTGIIAADIESPPAGSRVAASLLIFMVKLCWFAVIFCGTELVVWFVTHHFHRFLNCTRVLSVPVWICLCVALLLICKGLSYKFIERVFAEWIFSMM